MYNKINGINYELIENSSSKENLVFVHGSGCNHKFLRPLAKKLKDFNCYLIDLPDHGKSDNRNCTKVEDYVDAVAEFVATLDNVTIIGHSLGGTICLGVAAKSIPTVKKNVIISSGAKFDKLDQKIHNMVKNRKVNWLYLIKCLGSYSNLDVLMDFLTFEPSKVIIKDFDIDIRLDLENVMSNINVPTLIMAGSDDILTLPEYSHKMHSGIKDSELIMIPNVRHMLPVAKSTYVAQLVSEFIHK
ncbi:alpha/beta fold hydrolase [Clostridium sp. DJ247]|uniref:alpha/beta fold hydrolase n=1 Tax=Clostridium sp. DJ247 TaxID=2726188 RepID=UPI00162751BB|nr:alpha/beta hydrolase [Clostridium sp. DJ247]MBC2579602.1 alpha/beta hydrolase [Clostridium sp. DJ247]